MIGSTPEFEAAITEHNARAAEMRREVIASELEYLARAHRAGHVTAGQFTKDRTNGPGKMSYIIEMTVEL